VRVLLAAGVCTGLTIAGAFGNPSRARAQVSHIEASVRASQARAAITRGEPDEAIRLFQDAVQLGAPPRVLRELAQLLEQRSRYREAADAWTRFAALAPNPADRDRGIERREYLRRQSGLLRVRVMPFDAARTARVWYDHEPPRPVPAGGSESMVEGGTHRVRVEALHYAPFESMVPTAYGETVDVIARMHLETGLDGGTTAAVRRDADR